MQVGFSPARSGVLQLKDRSVKIAGLKRKAGRAVNISGVIQRHPSDRTTARTVVTWKAIKIGFDPPSRGGRKFVHAAINGLSAALERCSVHVPGAIEDQFASVGEEKLGGCVEQIYLGFDPRTESTRANRCWWLKVEGGPTCLCGPLQAPCRALPTIKGCAVKRTIGSDRHSSLGVESVGSTSKLIKGVDSPISSLRRQFVDRSESPSAQ